MGIIGLSSLACVAGMLYTLACSDALDTILNFFNGLLQLETEIDKAGKKLFFRHKTNCLKNKFQGFIINPKGLSPKIASGIMGNVVCKLIVATVMVTPWALGIGSSIMPCSPPNLLVLLKSSCKSTKDAERCKTVGYYFFKGAKFLIQSSAHIAIWKCMVGVGALVAIHVLVACTCQQTLMEIYHRYENIYV